MPSNLDFEVERLKEELKQETIKRDSVEQSVRDSEHDLSVLQSNLLNEQNFNADNNNWKSKYEKQHEKNSYLEQELALMKEKLEALSKTITESPTSKKTNQPDLDLRHLLRQLEHEKCVLEGKVKDTEWRLDSESKELFKLSEKKREYMLKLNQSLQSPSFLLNKKKTEYYGIPDNQRIIDPKKGPIKKQACVNLPKISKDDVNAVRSANKKYIKRNQYSKKKISAQEKHSSQDDSASDIKQNNTDKNNDDNSGTKDVVNDADQSLTLETNEKIVDVSNNSQNEQNSLNVSIETETLKSDMSNDMKDSGLYLASEENNVIKGNENVKDEPTET